MQRIPIRTYGSITKTNTSQVDVDNTLRAWNATPPPGTRVNGDERALMALSREQPNTRLPWRRIAAQLWRAAGCPCIGRDRVYRQRGERFRQRGAPNRRPGHTDEAQVRADSSPQGPMNGRSAAAPAARRHETLEPGGCGGDRSSDGGWTAPDPGRRLSAPYRKRGRTASVPRPALQDRTALGAGWIRTEPVFAVSVHRR